MRCPIPQGGVSTFLDFFFFSLSHSHPFPLLPGIISHIRHLHPHPHPRSSGEIQTTLEQIYPEADEASGFEPGTGRAPEV